MIVKVLKIKLEQLDLEYLPYLTCDNAIDTIPSMCMETWSFVYIVLKVSTCGRQHQNGFMLFHGAFERFSIT